MLLCGPCGAVQQDPVRPDAGRDALALPPSCPGVPSSVTPSPPPSAPPLPFRDCPQVKSLALSEDGPVIRRSVSEPYYNFFPRQMGESSNRNVLAPDPLAMLSDGERTVGGERAIGGRGEPGGERAIGGRGEPVLAFRKHLPLPLLAGLRDERDLADDVDEHVERERGLGGARASSSSGDVISRQMPSPA